MSPSLLQLGWFKGSGVAEGSGVGVGVGVDVLMSGQLPELVGYIWSSLQVQLVYAAVEELRVMVLQLVGASVMEGVMTDMWIVVLGMVAYAHGDVVDGIVE